MQPDPARTLVFYDIDRERRRQIAKWGDQSTNDAMTWCAVLGEEAGEVCKAALDSRPHSLTGDATLQDLRRELVQVAAVCVAWIEQLDAPLPTALDNAAR